MAAVDDDEVINLVRGGRVDVALMGDVHTKFSAAAANMRARMLRAMQRLSASGTLSNREAYRLEERRTVGNVSVAVYVFKAYQLRIYGGFVQMNSVSTWVGTAIDTAKKQDRANKQLLERAARRLQALQDASVPAEAKGRDEQHKRKRGSSRRGRRRDVRR